MRCSGGNRMLRAAPPTHVTATRLRSPVSSGSQVSMSLLETRTPYPHLLVSDNMAYFSARLFAAMKFLPVIFSVVVGSRTTSLSRCSWKRCCCSRQLTLHILRTVAAVGKLSLLPLYDLASQYVAKVSRFRTFTCPKEMQHCQASHSIILLQSKLRLVKTKRN